MTESTTAMPSTIKTRPARARTDSEVAPRIESAPFTPSISQRTVRRLGLGLTAGTLTWAATVFGYGTTATGFGGRMGDLGGFAFQLGVFCLLTIQLRTRATGLSRFAVGMLKVEYVLLGLASFWSLAHGLLPDALRDGVWLAVLDAFWPLSMLGMFVISIKLASAARWSGLLRWWPLVAESWAVVTVPSIGIFGEAAGRWVGGSHLVVGYALLGVLIALMPRLTGARD